MAQNGHVCPVQSHTCSFHKAVQAGDGCHPVAPLQAVHDMEEWACPLCMRRRGGLRTAALRSAPTKFDPEAAAEARTHQEEALAGGADLPRSARGRHADADTALPATGLKLRLPASTGVSMHADLAVLSGRCRPENPPLCQGVNVLVCVYSKEK